MVLLGLFAFAGVASSSANSSKCKRIHAGVSKRTVKPGQTVWVKGSTCDRRDHGPRFVRIKLHTRHGWRQVGIARPRSTGRFSRRVRVSVPPGRVHTSIQVVASAVHSPQVPLKVATDTPQGYDGCPLNDPNYVVDPTIHDCKLIASDTASNPDPIPFWGSTDCGDYPNGVEPRRVTHPTAGGDSDATATGAPQENEAYRRMTVFDGDEFFGERCELGFNNMDRGPTTFFRAGMRRVTYFSERLPENFELDGEDWQTVFQMKQAQPSVDNGGGPMIELQATRGEWILLNDWEIIWSVPAQKNFWTRFAFDVVYSQDPHKGSIQVSVDLNGDGDFEDANERSPKLPATTLSTQTEPGYEIPPGGSIPSHLRAGIYHSTRYSCPPPVGCSTELDNVQVIGD
ncbi:MAG TPA: heparin lyase I family protein [Fimbriimonas sp.]|nr:heparin lyase I family protein [Fimbriimonas sp.]